MRTWKLHPGMILAVNLSQKKNILDHQRYTWVVMLENYSLRMVLKHIILDPINMWIMQWRMYIIV